MKPMCEEFACAEYAFQFRLPGGGVAVLCEEHASARGLSSGGKSFHDDIPVRSIEEVQQEQACKLALTPEQLAALGRPVLVPASRLEMTAPFRTPRKQKGATMGTRGRAVRRDDTGEEFPTVELAAKSVGGSSGGLSGALSVNRPFKGVQFRFVDEVVQPRAEAARQAIVAATAEGQAEVRMVESPRQVSVTSVFAALSSMAAAMKGLRLSGIEITVGDMKVRVEQLELASS